MQARRRADRRTTLADIAKACGCTSSTVSRALSGDGRIGPELIERIRATAKKLGYRPNLAARTLVTGRTRTVLFLCGELASPTNHRPAEAAALRCHEHGLDLLVATHHGDRDTHVRLLDRLRQGLADGALVAAESVDQESRELQHLVRSGFPTVFVDRWISDLSAPAVSSDHAHGAAELTRRVIAAGARWVADAFWPNNPVEQARSAGVTAACADLGVRCVRYAAGEPLPDDGPIACITSGFTHILQIRAHSTSTQRPLLAGVFDQWIGDPPPLSRIWVCRQDFDAIARIASDRLAARMQGATDPERQQIRLVPIVEVAEVLPLRGTTSP